MDVSLRHVSHVEPQGTASGLIAHVSICPGCGARGTGWSLCELMGHMMPGHGENLWQWMLSFG